MRQMANVTRINLTTITERNTLVRNTSDGNSGLEQSVFRESHDIDFDNEKTSLRESVTLMMIIMISLDNNNSNGEPHNSIFSLSSAVLSLPLLFFSPNYFFFASFQVANEPEQRSNRFYSSMNWQH